MNERRRALRVKRTTRVRYRLVGSRLLDDVRDISMSGAFLACAEPFPLGARVELSFERGDDPPLVVEGSVVRVVWGGRDGGKPISPGMAIAFDALDDDAARVLERVVSSS